MPGGGGRRGEVDRLHAGSTAAGERVGEVGVGNSFGEHVPVLLDEVLRELAPVAGGRLADLTVGRGGHARALLQQALAEPGPCMPPQLPQLLAVDRDPDALAATASSWPEAWRTCTTFVHARFSDVLAHPVSQPFFPADAVLVDLGVSSPQLDEAERGFAFQREGPLDMRMDPTAGMTARDWLVQASEGEIARVLLEYGEERYSRRIARAIVAALASDPAAALRTTSQLAELVRRCVPGGGGRIHPATRTFQALRIAVNDELDELDRLLALIPRLLAPGGRLALISFHSLEDRRVKHAFRALATEPPNGVVGTPAHPPAHEPASAELGFELVTRRPIEASDEETRRNPRSRSAKLRVLRRQHPSDPSPLDRWQLRRARKRGNAAES